VIKNSLSFKDIGIIDGLEINLSQYE